MYHFVSTGRLHIAYCEYRGMCLQPYANVAEFVASPQHRTNLSSLNIEHALCVQPVRPPT